MWKQCEIIEWEGKKDKNGAEDKQINFLLSFQFFNKYIESMFV